MGLPEFLAPALLPSYKGALLEQNEDAPGHSIAAGVPCAYLNEKAEPSLVF